MKVYVNGVDQGGGGASIPNTPSAVLFDENNPNTVVALDGDGEGWARTYPTVVGTGLVGIFADAPAMSVVASNGAGDIEVLGLGALATQSSVDPATQLSSAVPLTKGGTGATDAAGARTNLGLGALATQSSVDPATQLSSAVPLTKGGTGATDAAGARNNLGLGALATQSSVTAAQISNASTSGRNILTGATPAFTLQRFYASDFTAENGSESASTSGTGAASTATITASSTIRVYGTGGATAARLVLPLPAGTMWATVIIEITASSGVSTSGFRYLAAAVRNAANAGAPSILWGMSLGDNGNFAAGNLMGGVNGSNQGPVGSNLGPGGIRINLNPRMQTLSIGQTAATGTPSSWNPPASSAFTVTNNSSTPIIPDPSLATCALAIWLQSYGGGGASSVTMKITVEAVVAA